tara:strand:- start:1001 stop:2083 length:1083 start_codon:yes stop_codon:yes gene_type:complete
MKNFFKSFKNKKIVITGHTGFKGAWLTYWLIKMDAKILGISNNYVSSPSLFKILKLRKKIKHKIIDIIDYKKVQKEILNFKPDFLFHLAAQSLVKKSYQNPLYTFKTNSIGTLNILDVLGQLKKKCYAVIITSDKSYKNLEIKRGYKETDLIGGYDPYSASKGAAELIIQSYMNSFFKRNKYLSIAVARAGNVIGGGDWSDDRLIPDCIKSWSKGKKVVLRNPQSTRPWQHVLDVIFGYLLLAINLKKTKKLSCEVFNFGPGNNQVKSVKSLVREMGKSWAKISWKIVKNKFFFEHNLLKLNSEKAKKKLNWKCILSFREAVKLTTVWYKAYYSKKNIIELTNQQLKIYSKKILRKSNNS